MSLLRGVALTEPLQDRHEQALSPEALGLLAHLHRRFEPSRQRILQGRAERARDLSKGVDLAFMDETRDIRTDTSWQAAPPAPGLVDRRVEITGPSERKMTINALNSGAKVWLADQEDASSPLWHNVVDSQVNLLDAVRGEISYEATDGSEYAVTAVERPTIVVRPRGWHLSEKHVHVDGERVSGALFDFAIYLATCGQAQVQAGSGPYFYLPKLQSHHEARLWNDVFNEAQDFIGMPRGTIRATVLIETLPAAFEMDEILFELRDHAAGLNAGRWDYIFSTIKSMRDRGESFLLPDRSQISMTVPFMRAYTELLVQTCHRRGTHAIGGMSAFVPSKDGAANELAFSRLTEDKRREAADGFDGSWVAHPSMVAACQTVFDEVLGSRPHQIDRQRPEVRVTAEDLLNIAATPGEVTEAGIRTNINVGIRYIESWLRGHGAVAINGLMEDVATAEISRSQVWQWLHLSVALPDETRVDRDLVERLVAEEFHAIHESVDPGVWHEGRWTDARRTFLDVAASDRYEDFLTVPAYEAMP